MNNLQTGSHVPPTDVDEVTMENMLSPKEFMENYMLPRKPLVFRGAVKEWPAFEKWTDEYLRDNYPNLELRMEGRKEKRTPIPQGDIALGRDSMKHFINTYHNPDVNKYVVSELPTPLYKYVNIPRPLGKFFVTKTMLCLFNLIIQLDVSFKNLPHI